MRSWKIWIKNDRTENVHPCASSFVWNVMFPVLLSCEVYSTLAECKVGDDVRLIGVRWGWYPAGSCRSEHWPGRPGRQLSTSHATLKTEIIIVQSWLLPPDDSRYYREATEADIPVLGGERRVQSVMTRPRGRTSQWQETSQPEHIREKTKWSPALHLQTVVC